MGFIFGTIRRLIKWVAYILLFATLVIFIPNLPPYADFTSIPLEQTLARTGSLAPNELLNNAQQLYKDKLLGPEAFQVFEGEVYTSLATGEIVKLSPGGHVTFVTKVGQPCKGRVEEEKCGRPLDFKIDEKQKMLIVADAYYGIWKVDLKTDKKQLLVSPHVEIEGRAPKLFNGVALDKNGDFFWTDSCSDFQLKDGAYCILTDPSGRLFHYNAAKNSSRVLVDNLWFANGVAVSPDRQFVVVAETAAFRLVKHYIDGPKKGRTEEFIAGLPGSPDNVRSLPDGSGVLVALYTVFDEEHPLLLRTLAQAPAARKFIARIQRLLEIPFEFLNTQVPHAFFQHAINMIGNFQTLHDLLPPMSGLVHVDWSGKVLAAYYNTDDSLVAVSDAVVLDDKLYLGAPHTHNYIAAVSAPEALKKAFTSPSTQRATTETKKAVPNVQEPPKPAPTKPPVVKLAETQKTTTPKPVTKPKVEPTPKPTQAPKQPEKSTTSPPQKIEKPTTPSAKKVDTPTTPPPKKVDTPTTPPPKKVDTPTTPPPKKVEKPTTPPTKQEKPTDPPKQEKPKSTPPKPVETKPKAAPKPAEPKEDKVKKATPQAEKKKAPKEKLPEQIPVEENIVSDTAKPKKESLKVIKKEGPVELPNLV